MSFSSATFFSPNDRSVTNDPDIHTIKHVSLVAGKNASQVLARTTDIKLLQVDTVLDPIK
jgi:hypothetical protein